MPNPTSKPRRHPTLMNHPRGVWRPEAVGVVRGYPRTAEEYETRCANLRATSDRARANGTNTRRDTPNGYAGRREEVRRLREAAQERAWQAVKILNRNSQHDDERLEPEQIDALQIGSAIPTTNAERAAMGLAFAIGVALSPAYGTAIRVQATRVFLPFVIPKPLKGRAPTGLSAAQEWLDGLFSEAGRAS